MTAFIDPTRSCGHPPDASFPGDDVPPYGHGTQRGDMRNLAYRKPATQSSVSPWSNRDTVGLDAQGAVDGDLDVDYGFHTGEEKDPWWQVDLQGLFLVQEVRIHNRQHCAQRLSFFSLLTSVDGIDWHVAFRKLDESVFGETDPAPYVVRLDGGQAARFVRVRLDGNRPLHFVECEILGTELAPDASATVLGRLDTHRYQQAFARFLDLAKDAAIDGREAEIMKMACVAVLDGTDRLRDIVKKANATFDVVQDAVRLVYGQDRILGPHGVTRGLATMSSREKVLVLERIEQIFAMLRHDLKLEPFFVAGSLLGFIREGAFLAHDDDYDTAYVSNERIPVNIVMERWDIYRHVRSLDGLEINECTGGHFHIKVKGRFAFTFDLFSGWEQDGLFSQFPTTPKQIPIADMLPVKSVSVYGVPVTVPKVPERLLALNYGENWRTPDPTFTFDWSRISRSYDFLLYNKLDRNLTEVLSSIELILDGLEVLDAAEVAALLADAHEWQADHVRARGMRPGIVVLDAARPERYLEQVGELARIVEDHDASLRFVGQTADGRILARLSASPGTAKAASFQPDGDA